MSVSLGQMEVNTFTTGKLAFYRGTTQSAIIDASGRFGIGINAPSASLQVGNATSNTSNRSTVAILSAASASATLDALSLINSANPANGNGTSINFHNASSYSPTAKIEVVQDLGTSASLRFYTYEGTLTEKMRINSSGSLLIGTTIDAGQRLQVSGSSLFQNSSVGTIGTFRSATANGQRLDVNSTATGFRLISGFDTGITGTFEILASGGNSSLILGTQATERMRIDNNGSVGIGKSTPTSRLDVSGSVLITGSLGVTQDITGSNARFSGTITAQSLIVEYVSSSIIYSSGSNKFGDQVSDTQQFTGSVTITGSLAVNGSNVILTNQTSSMSVLSASYARSASYAQSSSYADNLVVNGTFTFDATLTDYASVGSSIVGSNNLFTRATSSYTSVFVNYTAAKGTSARSGQLMVVWNNGTAQFTDNSTLDVGGDTGYVTMSAAIVTNQIQVNAQTNSSGWVIKSMATYM